jgi:hypothetical protein
MSQGSNNIEYFASLPTDDIGKKLVEKTEQYYRYIQSNGYYWLWKDVYRSYYYGFFSKGEIETWGKQGEKRNLTTNHFSSLLQHIKVLTTDQRPVFEPKAVNSDYKSAAQAILARGLLDYYMHKKDLEDAIDGAVDFALQAGEGYIFQEWNPDVGKVVGELDVEEEEDVEEINDEGIDLGGDKEDEGGGEPDEDLGEEGPESIIKREGDIDSVSLHPIDVVRDIYKDTTENNDWYIVRQRVNKFNLMARYPKFKEEIRNTRIDSTPVTLVAIDDYDFKRFDESDQTYKFTFRHKKTPALPEGRQVEFLADGTVLFDGDLPYSDIALYKLMPMSRRGTNFGYTVAFDLLPLQKAINTLNSTVITNQHTFGVQNIIAQKGSGVTATSLTGGLNLLEYSGDPNGKPEPLNLLSTPPEIFNYLTQLVQDAETISGVNSVSRGNPEASLRSGSSLALVQSMAIQFNSGLQHSYAMLLEDTGTGVINMLKEYANAPRVALVAGISKKAYLKEFKGEDLAGIDRITVDMGHPMSQTVAGRQEMASMMIERGLIDSPEQFLSVTATGRLDPLIEGKTAEIMNIRSENEKLAEGQQVYALYTDNHWLHIKEHKNVLSSPDARAVQEIIAITDNHIQEHIRLLRETDPGILMILGQQPIPSPVNSPEGGQPVAPIPNQPESETPVQGQAAAAPTEADAQAPSGMGTTGIQGVNMPSQPKNPMTDKEFNLESGGL